MVYKLVSEWRSKNGIEHEITIYKYNISHDEMVRYFVSVDGVRVQHFPCFKPNKTEYYDSDNKQMIEVVE